MTDIPKGSPIDLALRARRRQQSWGRARAGLWSWLFTRQQAKRDDGRTLVCGPRTICAAQRHGRAGGVER